MSEATIQTAPVPAKPTTTPKEEVRIEKDRMEDEGGAMGLSFQESEKKKNKA